MSDTEVLDAPADTAVVEVDRNALTSFELIESTLASLKALADGKVYDLTKTADNEAARRFRKNLVTLRVRTDELRKDLNREDQARIDARNAAAKRIENAVKAIETPLDEAISADEKRREDARKAKAQAEAARVAGHESQIRAIRALLTSSVGKSSADIRAAIDTLANREPRDWEEYAVSAGEAIGETKKGLESLLQSALDSEALAELRAREAERLRLEAEERQRQEEAARAEEQRKAEARDFIRGIEMTPNTCIGMASTFIEQSLARLQAMGEIELAEFTQEARAARETAMSSLMDMLNQTLDNERVAAENARAQAELAERRRQEEALAAETERLRLETAAEERRKAQAADKRVKAASGLLLAALKAIKDTRAWQYVDEDVQAQADAAIAAAEEA